MKHQETIPAYELVRACAEKITIGLNQITIRINAIGFKKLADNHLKLNMEGCNDSFEIVVPFKVGKEKHGAIVMKPEGDNRDIFDLPSAKLKKLVQGVIWRDEHFAGMTLKNIAHREKCSEGYVGTAIFESFEFPNAA